MDRVDLLIINELTADARKPFSEIAKKIGVSTQTVIRRYNEMKERGTIQWCAISINLSRIGYEGIAELLITFQPGKSSSETIDRLRKIENIIIATRAIGDYEGYAVLVFKSARDLYERVRQVELMPEIENVEMCFTTNAPLIMAPPPFNIAATS